MACVCFHLVSRGRRGEGGEGGGGGGSEKGGRVLLGMGERGLFGEGDREGGELECGWVGGVRSERKG